MTERKLWWHSDKETGRFWLHFGLRTSLNLEFTRLDPRLSFDINEERLGFCFLGFHCHLESWPIVSKLEKLQGQFSFYWFEDGLWFELWRHPMGDYYHADPWWKKMYHFNALDFVFGKAEHSKRHIATYEVLIPFYEGSYPAQVELTEATWKRPRAKARRVRLADIKVENPPKFPGKGENSWDQGDDGIWRMSCHAKSVSEAIGKYIEATLQNRFKRGSRDGWCKVIKEA